MTIPQRTLSILLCALPWWLGPWLTVTEESVALGSCEFPVCPWATTWPGLGCPGCGLTRSIGFALRFDFGRSWSMHPMGVFILGLSAVATAVHVFDAVRSSSKTLPLDHHAARTQARLPTRVASSAVLIGLVSVWLARILS